MQATRAYIGSARTAVVMLGGAVALFTVLSAFIAFGSWPGANSNTAVDQIVLRSFQHQGHASTVTVRPDAVALARSQARRARTVARATPPGSSRTHTPSAPATGGGSQGTQLASAPASGGGPAGGAGGTAKGVTKQVGDTTKQVTNQVQQGTDTVQNQVDQVVHQVIGPGTPGTSGTTGTVGGAVQQTTTTVTTTTGAILGH